MRGSRGGQGEDHKAIGFLNHTSLDPLENYKASKPVFLMLGHYRPASE